jgi:hypothetical protein
VFFASPVEGFSKGLTDLCWWRDNAELLHQPQVTIVVPVLDDLVALDAEDVESRGYITVGQAQGGALRAVEMELTDLTPFCYYWQTEDSCHMILLTQEHIV